MRRATLLKIVESIYEAAAEPKAWANCLQSLAQFLEARAAIVSLQEPPSQGVALVQVGIDPESVDRYNRYYHRLDAWARSPKAADLIKVGAVALDEMFIPRDRFVRGEFFNDFASRYKTTRMMTAAVAFSPETGFSMVSAMRAEQDRPFAPADLRRLGAIAPHLRRAVRLQRLVAGARRERDALMAATDAASIGVILGRPHGTPAGRE